MVVVKVVASVVVGVVGVDTLTKLLASVGIGALLAEWTFTIVHESLTETGLVELVFSSLFTFGPVLVRCLDSRHGLVLISSLRSLAQFSSPVRKSTLCIVRAELLLFKALAETSLVVGVVSVRVSA